MSHKGDLVDLAMAARNFMLLVSKLNAETLHEVLTRESVIEAVEDWEETHGLG